KSRMYRFLFLSVCLTPTFAALTFGPAFPFAIALAFYFLALFVLPPAFAGLGIGYFVGKREAGTEVKRLKHALIGYLAGYVLGLNIVFRYPLAGIASSYALLSIAAFGGLVAAFHFSRAGTTQVSNYNSQATSGYLKNLESARARRFKNIVLL